LKSLLPRHAPEQYPVRGERSEVAAHLALVEQQDPPRGKKLHGHMIVAQSETIVRRSARKSSVFG
jgi:hypothetical protein